MTTAPIVLVPGFWLGAWAWDEVADALRAGGHDVTALTLPGLESVDTDRSAISLSDHVDAICEAVRAAGAPVVLAVHSGAGGAGYAASDRVPELIAAMVYDSGPATGALEPDFDGVEKPLPSREELEEEENLDGLSEKQLETFRRQPVPQPGGVLREAPVLTNDARLDVPSIVVCTGFPSEQIKAAVKEGYAWLGGLAELRDVTYVDLPTSHWPMWSRPPGARRDHRRRREASYPRRPMTTSLLSDAFAHHVWATVRLIDTCTALTPARGESSLRTGRRCGPSIRPLGSRRRTIRAGVRALVPLLYEAARCLLMFLKSLPKQSWSRTAIVTGGGPARERTVLFYAQWLARHERAHVKHIGRIVKTMRVEKRPCMQIGSHEK